MDEDKRKWSLEPFLIQRILIGLEAMILEKKNLLGGRTRRAGIKIRRIGGLRRIRGGMCRPGGRRRMRRRRAAVSLGSNRRRRRVVTAGGITAVTACSSRCRRGGQAVVQTTGRCVSVVGCGG